MVLAALGWGGRFEKYTGQICFGIILKGVFPFLMTICESVCGEDEFKRKVRKMKMCV